MSGLRVLLVGLALVGLAMACSPASRDRMKDRVVECLEDPACRESVKEKVKPIIKEMK